MRGFLFIGLLWIGGVLAGQPTPAPPTTQAPLSNLVTPSQYAFSHTPVNLPVLSLYWNIIGDNLEFGVICRDVGYCGVGFGTQMYGADVVWVYKQGSALIVEDGLISLGPKRDPPVADPIPSVTMTSSIRTATETHFKFTRAKDTGDPADFVIVPGPISMIAAVSDSDVLLGHGPNRLVFTVTLVPLAPTTAGPTVAGQTLAPTPAPTTAGPTSAPMLVNPASYANTWSSPLLPGFTLYWKIVGSDIDLAIIAQSQGWVALGFGTTMVGSDCIWARQVAGSMVVEDAVLEGPTRSAPVKDTQNDVRMSGGDRTATHTHAFFRRALDTGDAADAVISPGPVDVILAHHATSDLGQAHAPGNRGAFQITFIAAAPTAPPTAAPTVFGATLQPTSAPTTSGPTVAPPPAGIVDPMLYANSITNVFPGFSFYWNTLTDSIQGAIVADCQGWVSLGFGELMVPSDVLYAHDPGGGPVVFDAGIDGPTRQAPVADASQDISGSVFRTATQTHVKFTRKFDTGDPSDFVISAGDVSMIAAMHLTADIGLAHSRTNRAVFPVNFLRGTGVVTPTAASTFDPAYYGKEVLVFKSLKFYWNLKASSIEIALEGSPTASWLGFGVTDQQGGGMINADMVIATNDFQGTRVRQFTSPQWDTPLVSTAATTLVASSAGFSMSGNFVAQFEMPLVIVSGSTTLECIFATGPDGSTTPLAYHTRSSASTLRIDLQSGALMQQNTNLIVVHGVLMGIAWVVCAACAVFIAAFVPKSFVPWFPLHVLFAGACALLAVLGFALGIAHMSSTTGTHFLASVYSATKGSHAVIGVLVIAFMLAQVTLGIVADRLWRREFKASGGDIPQPTTIDYIHRWTGRLLPLLALVNVFLGFVEMNLAGWTYAVLAVFCALVGVIFVLLTIQKRKLGGDDHGSDPIQL